MGPAGCPSTSTLTSTTITGTTTTGTATSTSTSTWTWTSTTTESRDSCVMDCEFDGKVATCLDRIDFAAEQLTANENDPREAARVLVSRQCGFCMDCGSSQYSESENVFVKKFEVAFGSKHHTIVKGLFSTGVLSAVAALLLVVGVASVARRHDYIRRRRQVAQFSAIDNEMGNVDAAMLSESDVI